MPMRKASKLRHMPVTSQAAVVFSFGIPIGISVLMLSRMNEYGSRDETDRFIARRVADELKVTDVEAADAIRDVTTGREYSFLVNAFK